MAFLVSVNKKVHEYISTKLTPEIKSKYFRIGDNAVTSSIRIAQVFPKLVGKKTHATLKFYRGKLKYMVNYALHLAHFDIYFHINYDAKKCDILVSQIILFSLIIHFNCFHMQYL